MAFHAHVHMLNMFFTFRIFRHNKCIFRHKKAKKFARIDIKDLRSLLVHEDSMAGGYDLMDIVALKVIERSKIKTRIINADIKTIEKALKGQHVGTEIVQ